MELREPHEKLTSVQREIVREQLAEVVAQVLAPVFDAERDPKERRRLRN